jgi:hypothetical protein
MALLTSPSSAVQFWSRYSIALQVSARHLSDVFFTRCIHIDILGCAALSPTISKRLLAISSPVHLAASLLPTKPALGCLRSFPAASMHHHRIYAKCLDMHCFPQAHLTALKPTHCCVPVVIPHAVPRVFSWRNAILKR